VVNRATQITYEEHRHDGFKEIMSSLRVPEFVSEVNDHRKKNQVARRIERFYGKPTHHSFLIDGAAIIHILK
jgi:hypothetical protein